LEQQFILNLNITKESYRQNKHAMFPAEIVY